MPASPAVHPPPYPHAGKAHSLMPFRSRGDYLLTRRDIGHAAQNVRTDSWQRERGDGSRRGESLRALSGSRVSACSYGGRLSDRTVRNRRRKVKDNFAWCLTTFQRCRPTLPG